MTLFILSSLLILSIAEILFVGIAVFGIVLVIREKRLPFFKRVLWLIAVIFLNLIGVILFIIWNREKIANKKVRI